MIFVPPRFAADSILEAAAAGVELVIAITEGIPAHDELRVYNTLKRDHPGTRLIGPNCPGILSPGKANVGIIPASFFKQGNVGVVSRSGTLTYQIGNEIAQAGFGCSSIVGIGGDPVPGSSFVDVLELFEADDETELIVLSGEIGGSAEEEAAEYIAENVSKPVVAYIAGFTAPAGKQMGHAGAIVSGSSGTAAAKAQALEAKGVRVGRTPTEAAEIAVEVLGGASSPARLTIAAPAAARLGALDRELAADAGASSERKLAELEASWSGRVHELDAARSAADAGERRRRAAGAHRARSCGASRASAGCRRRAGSSDGGRSHRRRATASAVAAHARVQPSRIGAARATAAARPAAAGDRSQRRCARRARGAGARRARGRGAEPSCCASASAWSARRAS